MGVHANAPCFGTQIPLHTLQVNALFPYDLLTTEHDGQPYEAIITLATSGKRCTCDGASAMVYLQ